MAKKHESKRNIEDLTEPEIYDAIRCLESNPGEGAGENYDSWVVISVSLLILLLGCLGVMLLYWR
jgi:hypothetical protein